MKKEPIRNWISALALALSAVAPAYATGGAWVTDSAGKRQFQVLDLGPEIGRGANGEVHAAEVQLPDGTRATLALKVFHEKPATKMPAVQDFARLNAFFRTQPVRHVHPEIGGLQLEVGGKPRSIVVSELATGSIDQWGTFLLNTRAPDFRARLVRTHRLMTDVAKGLIELKNGGLAHGDVQPRNIYLMKGEGGARFVIGDLDQALPSRTVHRSAGAIAYLPPEFFNQDRRVFSAARDTFALASSVYEMGFGALPWLDFIKNDPVRLNALERWAHLNLQLWPELNARYLEHLKAVGKERFGPDSFLMGLIEAEPDFGRELLMEAQREVYGDRKLHNEMLNWVDQRFAELEKRAAVGDQAMIRQLQNFTRRGLAFESVRRESALTFASNASAPVRAPGCADRYNSFLARFLTQTAASIH